MAKRRRMVRSKVDPSLFGYIVRWIGSEVFVVSVRGQQILATKEFWEEY